SLAGPFTRLSGPLIKDTGFVDSNPPIGAATYMVRAVKLESTPSGSYFNSSQGALISTQEGFGSGIPIVRSAPVKPLKMPAATATSSATSKIVRVADGGSKAGMGAGL